MAEGILRDFSNKYNMDIKVKSAGVSAINGYTASPNAVIVMGNMGIDISKHKSKLITEDMINQSDLIFTMSNSHKDVLIWKYPNIKDKVFLLNEYAFDSFKNIEDPFGGGIEEYEIARDEIYKAILSIIEDGSLKSKKQ